MIQPSRLRFEYFIFSATFLQGITGSRPTLVQGPWLVGNLNKNRIFNRGIGTEFGIDNEKKKKKHLDWLQSQD